MDSIKYTTDGKKVKVIGELNQTEKIVQEIYVTESGEEIPQGRHFIAKDLLDEPAKTWRELRMEQIEIKFDNIEKDWERKIRVLEEEKKSIYSSLTHSVKWLKNVAREPDRSDMFIDVINTLALFLSDEDKWIFFKDYGDWYIKKFDDYGKNPEFEKYDDYSVVKSLRLISLYGNTDGNLVYGVNEFSDGSGSHKEFKIFGSREEAVIFAQSILDEKIRYGDKDIENAERLGLTLGEEKLKFFKDSKIEALEREISNCEDLIRKAKDNLKKYK